MAETTTPHRRPGYTWPSLPAAVNFRRRLAAAVAALEDTVIAEQERWVLWLPVMLGTGIGIYFALAVEPPAWIGYVALASALTFGAAGRRSQATVVAATMAGTLALGFVAAQMRTVAVAAPVLTARVGPVQVEGTIAEAMQLAPSGLKLIIEDLTIEGIDPDGTPGRVRLTVRAKGDPLEPGDRISLTAVLMPPPEPVAPGAFDFARQAWFQGIGAVGFAVSRARLVPVADGVKSQAGLLDRWSRGIARARFLLSHRIRQQLPGDSGAMAAALMTGDRGSIPEPVVQTLRDAGLAHLLAISGLHMGLLAAILFFAVRALLALSEHAALYHPIKKWSAAAALAGALGYLLLTGGTVSTQRAFVMTGIVLVAVMLDRAAVTMRLVAWAAAFVLLVRPESLWQPGFQMSFAAVIALIATYERYRYREAGRRVAPRTRFRRLRLYLAGVVLTSLVAGLATAPYAAFHFNRFVDYGLAANLVAVPVMAMWIMPWAMAAFALLPLGLDGLALSAMGWGIDAVIWVAATVASWPGAVTLIPAIPVSALVVLSLGGLWLCLWNRRWRFLGLIPMAAALAMPLAQRSPDVLVGRDAKLVGVRAEPGKLMVSDRRAARFTRDRWLRQAGLANTQSWPDSGSSAGGRLVCDTLSCLFQPLEGQGIVVAVVSDARALAEDCRAADVVVSLVPVRMKCPSASRIVDRFDLWRNGAHALWFEDGRIRIESANGRRGRRPWVAFRGRQKKRE